MLCMYYSEIDLRSCPIHGGALDKFMHIFLYTFVYIYIYIYIYIYNIHTTSEKYLATLKNVYFLSEK